MYSNISKSCKKLHILTSIFVFWPSAWIQYNDLQSSLFEAVRVVQSKIRWSKLWMSTVNGYTYQWAAFIFWKFSILSFNCLWFHAKIVIGLWMVAFWKKGHKNWFSGLSENGKFSAFFRISKKCLTLRDCGIYTNWLKVI